MSERKAFNFYKSYFDVYVMLGDKQKVEFMDALLNKQFNGIDPESLSPMANFAYISQKNNIDQQVKGWEDKTGCKLGSSDPTEPPTEPPTVQEKEKEKEKEQGKVHTWRDDFNIYKNELREIYLDLINDDEYISLQEKYRPSLDIKLSLEKACMLYWATEAGWEKKKSKKSKTLDWKQTLTNALDMNSNKVYKNRN